MIPSLNDNTINCESQVKCHSVQNNFEAVMYTCNEALYHPLLLTHIKLEGNESLMDVDKWCSQIHQTMAPNSFFITILAGSLHNKAHGACFLHIKNPYHNHASRYNST